MRDPFEIYTSWHKPKNSKSLDWEESALDEHSDVEGFFDENRQGRKFSGLKILILVSCLILGVKLFDLQVMRGSNYRLLAEGNRIRNQTVLAPRGIIKDAYGEVLAQNTASFNLIATPFDLPKEGLDIEITELAKALNVDPEEIWKKVNVMDRTSFQPVTVLQDISKEQSILFETENAKFLGFSIQNIPIRQYIDAPMFSHLLGYAGIVSENELDSLKDEGYEPIDYIGKSGIELSYEKYLKGVNGQDQIEVDVRGNPIKILGEIEAEPGNIAELNIDKGLQKALFEGFQKFSTKAKGAAVAINPKNGQVLALLSLPGFDNNLFAHGIKQGEYQNLITDKNLPLFNRAIAGTYPPGSTAKLIVGTAALQEGVIDPSTVVIDRGQITVPNQFDPSSQYIFRGWKVLGPMTMTSAIAMSSDIYFYAVSGGSPDGQIKGLGAEKVAEYYRKFSLGKVTGIDLQGEKPGLVPDPEWKAEYFKGDPIASKWYLGDTYHVGIGQGDLLVTPLQVASWTAAIANGGTIYKPNLLKQIVDQSGNKLYESKPEVLIKDVADRGHLKVIAEGMREGVVNGTGRALNTLSISSASKTGTSQFDGSDPRRTHAWFTLYAPYEDPEIVIVVLVEAGGEGSAAAAPIAKQALDWWAKNRYKK